MQGETQTRVGIVLGLGIVIIGALALQQDIFLRLLLGLGLGVALTKGSIGFAGSVNRAYRRGSTQLIQTLMLMFVVTAIINAGLLLCGGIEQYQLWINPINLGLIVGGLMFGFGMTLSSCCASGVMVEMVSDVPRALVTLLMFGAGVFIGLPIQSSSSIVQQTWISTSSFEGQGVFLPDLFSWGPLNGYLMSVVFTIAMASLVIYIARRYENSRKKEGSYLGVDGEKAREQIVSSSSPLGMLSGLWTMNFAAIVIAIIFGIMMATTSAGWGASTPFGLWFGKLLIALGLDSHSVASFTQRPEHLFTMPFFEHGVSVQNLGILLGTLIAVFWLGKWASPFKSQYTLKHYALFSIGGLLMGVGTRFANGCNVGALYTPIANFSLSGWIFFGALVAGGILGNQFARKVKLIATAPTPQPIMQ
ncbi:YeeE/YedE family protein [Vibrio superstes]|uniref:Membrane protein n=1 Tax=Vibrio superstes NBRC 103154 TaxID=1219062 RepID=A0A511QL34_9VIBR|nr:YeeE/YedE family protein [Vibrio superstes]GEM78025.1 membrane protein [Vibrio superstes NBRC 103154]